ncbi:MAG: YbaK/EbsC family protein [Nitriliruptorales bacterium]|nr:YbaK/EbsC family protein [Nitriliruptorales bacterium]
MPSAVERFMEQAQRLGVDVRPTTFPEGTRTAEQAAAAIGCELGQIVKSLVFMADDEPVLVLTSGANRVDEGKLAHHLHAERVERADPDQVRDATGFAIGGTPPFGHPEQLPTLVDPDLLRFETVYAAAGSPTDVFPVSPSALRAAADADVVDVNDRQRTSANTDPSSSA